MKFLIISGTPKKEGICHSFVETATKTITTLGIEAEVIRLADEKLVSCKMCGDGWGTCSKEYRCAFGADDGFSALQDKVKEAAAFIYITPVYWGDISEGMKIFIDKLRRVEATKSWNKQSTETSSLKGKPSIIVANAGGGGGGVLSALAILERAVSHMGGDSWPRETSGIFDMITVNRCNQTYKLKTLEAAITAMHKALQDAE